MDLKNLAVSTDEDVGAIMEVVHPNTNQVIRDDEGNSMRLLLAGTDSDRVQKVRKRYANQKLKSRGRVKVTIDEIEDQALEILAAATIDWAGIVENGQTVPCSFANARRLYKEYPWLREQVDDFINDRANYLGNSLKSSLNTPVKKSKE